MNTRAINLNATWTYVNAVLKPEEKGRCHTVVGTILRPRWGVGELAKATKADVREVLVFTNERFLAISPHPTRSLRLRDTIRAARGDNSVLGRFQEFPRAGLAQYQLSRTPPLEDTRIRALFVDGPQWLSVHFQSGDQIRMMLDEASDAANDLDERLERYFRGERW